MENQAIAYRIAWEILYGKEAQQEEGEQSENGERISDIFPAEEKKLGGRKPGEGKPSGSGIGGGDDQFVDWWHMFRGNTQYMRWLMEKAERMVLTSESKCEHTFLTKEDAGPLEGDKRRHFFPGDDPESIDYEETVDELIRQGRELSQIRYDDFVLRERRGQRKAVAILQDVSGSMNLGLRPCLMCAAILLCVLRNHEVALALFENNQYVIKRFFDRKPWDEVVDAILSAQLRAQGGTMGGRTLEWCKEELKKVDGRYCERECIIFSDFGYFDREKVAAEIKEIGNMGVKIVIILPPILIYQSVLDMVLSKADCTVVKLDRIKEEEVGRLAELIGTLI